MSKQQEAHYKERSPEETVEKLRGILSAIDVEVEETWIPKSSADTFSLRLVIKGTDIGANGKGVSRSYARASAYAEFMERLQNHFFLLLTRSSRETEGFEHFPDERLLDSRQLGALDNAMMEQYFAMRGMEASGPEERAAYLRKYYKTEFFLECRKDSYEVLPFYSVSRKRTEYVPYYLCMLHYGSNGMCAGNTAEEALVQGLSEILERHVQEKIFLEHPVLPDIPDEYIQRFPCVWERIQMLREQEDITVYLKDASFGGAWPVAALLIIGKDTGRYGIKLGCHPDYGIAMERAITESSQGGDFKDYALRSGLTFDRDQVTDPNNIYNSYRMGFGNYPCQLFEDTPDWEFTEMSDVSHKSNRELLTGMISGLRKEGYDILIRDVSWLGFPTYQILVPGMSEILRDASVLTLKIFNTRSYLIPYLNYPESLEETSVRLLRGVVDYLHQNQFSRDVGALYGGSPDFEFPGEEIGYGWLYLSAMCSYYLGDFADAAQRLRGMAEAAKELGSPRALSYRVLFYYISAKAEGLSEERILSCLRKFFGDGQADRAAELLREPEKVFVKQYPRNDYLAMEKEGKELPGWYGIWCGVRRRLKAGMKANPISQEAVGELLDS